MILSGIAYHYLATAPPSIVISAPVIKDDSPEARNKAAHAISIGSATRPCGDICFILSFISGNCSMSFVIGVSTAPGQIVFTRILSLAKVTARSFDNKRNPPFDEE